MHPRASLRSGRAVEHAPTDIIEIASDSDDDIPARPPPSALLQPRRAWETPVPLPENVRHMFSPPRASPLQSARESVSTGKRWENLDPSGRVRKAALPHTVKDVGEIENPVGLTKSPKANSARSAGTNHHNGHSVAESWSEDDLISNSLNGPEKRRASTELESGFVPPRKKTKGQAKFYGVQIGKIPGVYTKWEDVKEMTYGFPFSKQRSFLTREDAQAFVDEGRNGGISKPRPDPNAPARVLKSRDIAAYINSAGSQAGSGPVTAASSAGSGSDANSKGPSNRFSTNAGSRPQTINGVPTVSELNTALARKNRATRTAMATSPHVLDPGKPLAFGSAFEKHPFDTLERATAGLSESQCQIPSAAPKLQSVSRSLSQNAFSNSSQALASRTDAPRPSLSSIHEPSSSRHNVRSNFANGHTATTSNTSTKTTLTASFTNNQSPAQGPRTSQQPGLTEEDEHLIIFLKEIEKVKWVEMEKYFPGRKWTILQTRYSSKLNKRDRNLDPKVWNLPARYKGIADAIGKERPTQPASLRPPPTTESSQPVIHSAYLNLPSTVESSQSVPKRRSEETDQTRSILNRSTSRPRRNVQAVDYTWPRQRTQSGPASEDGEDNLDAFMEETQSTRPGSDPSEEPSVTPDAAVPVHQPLDLEFDEENVGLIESGQSLPYLSHVERKMVQDPTIEWDQRLGREWQGSVVHVDFSTQEIAIVQQVVDAVVEIASRGGGSRKLLRQSLIRLPEPKMLQIAAFLHKRLQRRDRGSIASFLQDARNDRLRSHTRVDRLGAVRLARTSTSAPKASVLAQLRDRELGYQSPRGWKSASESVTYRFKNSVYDTMGPICRYTGASSDVHTVAWSPDGQAFAAGAVCVTDTSSRQYNRPNNLLYGDCESRSIYELAEHYVDREKAETGPNSTHAMHVTQDPRLFTTVSAVAFSPHGDYMLSAGYDKHARLWTTDSDHMQPVHWAAFQHGAEVDLLASAPNGLFATAAKRRQRAIKVIRIDEHGNTKRHTYSSKKADDRPDDNILPTALKFEPRYGSQLLAGFGANRREDRMDSSGDICLWDVERKAELQVYGGARNVFDVDFSLYFANLFAVGCVAGSDVNRGMRSTVRLYDGLEKRSKYAELECPALDMNEVVFCPYDANLISAGCTNGRVYLWDIRRPDMTMFALSHSHSLTPLGDQEDHEVVDTGVRFLSWGENATRLYSGSSDGVVKVWDITSSQEEVYIKDLLQCDSGIMSGAFSPDFSKLLVGEVNGSLNVLEVGNDDRSARDAEKLKHFDYVSPEASEDENDHAEAQLLAMGDGESGQAIARELLASGQITYMPFGGLPLRQAVQGPHYVGPYDMRVDAPYLREQALQFQHSLARSPGPQCGIPSCGNNIILTDEELGDSGRSLDRIPDELRKQWLFNDSSLSLVPGKSRCSNCGRPARPSESSTNPTETLCERCCFTCFRCGTASVIESSTQKLYCRTCSRVWSIGALGYECIEETGSPFTTTDVLDMPGYKKTISRCKRQEENASFGDEMNALTDHYLSLAIDRPESPPL